MPTHFPGATPGGVNRLARLAESYPELAAIADPDWHERLARARQLRLPALSPVLGRDIRSERFVLLLAGTVRVYQIADDGREITLYRVGPGDICVMSLAGLLGCQPFHACIQAETDIEALLLDASDFRAAMAGCAAFRDWVVGNLTTRFCGLLGTFHDTVFDPLAIRLACLLGRLFERAEDDGLHITHQQLAHELGTTREVISRHLKAFERHGCILLSRGCIRMAPGQHLPLDIG